MPFNIFIYGSVFWHNYCYLRAELMPDNKPIGLRRSNPTSATHISYSHHDKPSCSWFWCDIFHKVHPGGKVNGATLGPIWGRQDPGGPHFGPLNLAIWADTKASLPGSLHKCRHNNIGFLIIKMRWFRERLIFMILISVPQKWWSLYWIGILI